MTGITVQQMGNIMNFAWALPPPGHPIHSDSYYNCLRYWVAAASKAFGSFRVQLLFPAMMLEMRSGAANLLLFVSVVGAETSIGFEPTGEISERSFAGNVTRNLSTNSLADCAYANSLSSVPFSTYLFEFHFFAFWDLLGVNWWPVPGKFSSSGDLSYSRNQKGRILKHIQAIDGNSDRLLRMCPTGQEEQQLQ